LGSSVHQLLFQNYQMNSPLHNQFETQIRKLTGFPFQEFVTKLLMYKYGELNFISPRKNIDKGADGIILIEKEQIIVACFGTENNSAQNYCQKIRADLNKYNAVWQTEFPIWMFVTNHDVPSEAIQEITEINNTKKIIGISNLLELIFKLKPEERKKLGEYLSIKDIFFYEELDTVKKEIICCQGKLLNKDFRSSLLPINVCKYLVYDRYSNIRIWIGYPNIISKLNEIEHLFEEITNRQYGIRSWEIIDIKEFGSSKKDFSEGKILVISSFEDYKLLQYSNYTQLKEVQSIIICFNFPNISLSKIYANDLCKRLEKSGKSVPVIIEDDIHLKKSIGESASFPSLFRTILELPMHIPEEIKPILELFCEKEPFDSTILNFRTLQYPIINKIYSIIWKFGNLNHRKILLQSIKYDKDPGEVFAILKDDFYSIKEFLSIATSEQLKAIISNKRRNLLLLLLASQSSEIKKDELDQLLETFKLKNNSLVNKIRNNGDNSLPKTTIEFWIIKELQTQQYKKFIKNRTYNHLNTEMNYVRMMGEDHAEDSLKRILKEEDLRLGFKIINPDKYTPQVERKFSIEENLFIYEI
jgi:hypothetical protein